MSALTLETQEQELTVRQERFIAEYILEPNATQAAIKAGYSEKTARQGGAQLLSNINVSNEIARRQKAHMDKLGITTESVLLELRKLGYSNMQDYMKATPNGDPYLDFSSLTRDQAAALTEVTVEDYTEGRGENARDVKRVKFKLADKRAALVDIGRHLGMFKDKENSNGGGSTNINVDLVQIMMQSVKGAE